MKRKYKIIIIALLIVSIIAAGRFGLFKNINTIRKKVYINSILSQESYSYLPEEAKDYIKEIYNETGKVILTEKNKKKNKLYLNPQYVDYLTYSEEEKSEEGEIPIPMVVDYSTRNVSGSNNIPSSYDLSHVDDNNYVTPIRDQGNLGICWTFATAGAAESHILKTTNSSYPSTSKLISERQIDYATSYNGIKDYKSEYVSFIDRGLGDGGNFYISTIAMANGISLVDYNSFKEYDDTDLQKMELSDVLSYDNSLYEVNSTINFPRLSLRESTSILTTEETEIRNSYLAEVKQKIMKDGAAYVGTYMGTPCRYEDSKLNNTVIDVYECNTTGSHAMEIIGWDDNIEYSYCADTVNHKGDTSNCMNVVSGKGVWILKNSWGESLQNPYLTYDSLYTDISFIDEMESSQNKNWDNNYIIGKKLGYSDSSKYTLENTKIKDDETIKKVKFIALTSNTRYSVKIKKKNGTYKTFSKTSSLPGLITIDITEDILVNKNTEITVYGEDEFIDRISIFTANVSETPSIDLSKYDNYTLSDDSIRLYSETKNIPSGSTITYKVYDSNEQDVSNKFTFTNNVVAENNINTLANITSDLDNGEYRIDAIYNSNVLESININIAQMEGQGSKNNPYIITNTTQLYQIRNDLDAYYELENDIDLTEDTSEGGKYSLESFVCPQGFGWESIKDFSGSLDGKGHTIKGLRQDNYIYCADDYYTAYNKGGNGLFSRTKGNVTIKNLILEDFDINCSGNYCGALVSSYINNDQIEYTATFENIAIKNSKVRGTYNNFAQSSFNISPGGGLFGYFESRYSNINISNIYIDINIDTTYLSNPGFLAYYIFGNEINIQNIRLNRDFKGKYSDGSGADILVYDLYEPYDSPSLKNVISTVRAKNVASLLGGVGSHNGTIVDGINILNIDDKPLCNSNHCQNATHVNIYDKDTELVEFTKQENYNSWTGFSNNWKMETIDGIPRIPVLKFMDFEYTSIPDISLNQVLNKHENIYDYVTPNIDAAKRIFYKSNNDEVVTMEEDGTIVPQSTGNTTIHIESLYDGYIKDVPISVSYIPHYTVNFDGNGGTGEMSSIEVEAGTILELPENEFEKENYELKEWNTKADGTGESYTDLGEIPAMNDKESITLYAIWWGEERLVRFHPNGGTVNPDRKVVRVGENYGDLPIPVRDGYGFDEWRFEGTNFISHITALKEFIGTDLIALWISDAYTIIYDANGGTIKSEFKTKKDIRIQSETIASTYGENNKNKDVYDYLYEREGFIFKEWNTKSDGTGTSYTNEDVINRSSNITLYAIWEEITESISVNPTSIDFGDVYTDDSDYATRTVTIKNIGNVDVVLGINNPTSSGPFGSSGFEVGKVLKPNEEYTASLIINPSSPYHEVPGTYSGEYSIIGTNKDNPNMQTIVKVNAEVVIKTIPNISYTTHVQSYGWQKYVKNGEMAGTSGEAKRLEGIKIKLENQEYSGDVEYRTHVQSYGWQEYVKNDEMSGTSGEAKRLEAIQIRLTGEMAEHYDIYYRVHAQSYGWLGWAKNDELSGTAGLAKRLEGIEIQLVEKGGSPKENEHQNDNLPYYTKLVEYTTHVQSYGWQMYSYDGGMAGTSGEAKRLEGIRIHLSNQKYSGDIEYRTHVQSYGWQEYVKNDEMSGTEGEAKRLEAIQIRLTGEMAEHYDIYYRVHAQSYGWLGWAKNDEKAGTAGFAKRLEGIEIQLVEKGKSPKENEHQNDNLPFYE